VSQIANYFKKHKPRAKILLVDANPNIVSKGPLFRKAWADLYPGMIEYRGNSKCIGVDATTKTVKLEVEDVKGDVLNVVPPQRAGDIARKTGLITANDRWCGVDWRTTESTVAKGVHVLGDSTLSAPGMPKSGSMANQQAKVCAAAVVAMINGQEPNPDPKIVNTCYSFVSDDEVIHVASVHELDASKKTFVPIKGAGGVSAARNTLEGMYAWSWAQNIWADTLG
jgi:NADH dehydrogenase FAD-containing subunit